MAQLQPGRYVSGKVNGLVAVVAGNKIAYSYNGKPIAAADANALIKARSIGAQAQTGAQTETPQGNWQIDPNVPRQPNVQGVETDKAGRVIPPNN
jgi:hypothetical protein